MSVKEDWRRPQTVSDEQLKENWKLMFGTAEPIKTEEKIAKVPEILILSGSVRVPPTTTPIKASDREILGKVNFGWSNRFSHVPDYHEEYIGLMARYIEEKTLKDESEIIDYLANANLPALIRLNNSIIKAIEKKRLDLGVIGESK